MFPGPSGINRGMQKIGTWNVREVNGRAYINIEKRIDMLYACGTQRKGKDVIDMNEGGVNKQQNK